MNTKNNFSDWEFSPVIDKVIAFQLVDGDTRKMQEYCPELEVFKDKKEENNDNCLSHINENTDVIPSKIFLSNRSTS